MCLAIPGQIVEIVDAELQIAKAEVSGVKRPINLSLLSPDEAKVGNWVLIHVGFALSCIDEQEARETFELLQQMGSAFDDEIQAMDESAALHRAEA